MTPGAPRARYDSTVAYPTAIDIVSDIGEGRRTAVEVLGECLARIGRDDHHVRAFIAVFHEDAMAAAARIDNGGPGANGPLAGVPVAVKGDLDVAGHVTTFGGSGFTKPAGRDCEVVRRLRSAGAVVVGATAMPETLSAYTESIRFGTPENPAALGRTVGGSSGGSAAAVAAGMVPIAIGEDAGGSIRIPAACTGIIGVKTQRGRVPLDPNLFGTISVLGPLARTAADAALVLDVISDRLGFDEQRSSGFGETLEAARSTARSLRIGWTLACPDRTVRVERAIAARVRSAATALGALSHDVRPVRVRWPGYLQAAFSQYFTGIRAVTRLADHPERMELMTRRMARCAAPEPVLARARRQSADAAAGLEREFERLQVDVILTPTMAVQVPAPGGLDGSSVAVFRRVMRMVAFTQVINVTGHPAVSVPFGTTPDGSPMGMHIVARQGREDVALAVADQLLGNRPLSVEDDL